MAEQRNRRYSDKELAAPRHHISRLAFLLAALLIAVSAVSLLFVGYIASHASNRQAVLNEERLFSNALEDRMRLVVREQLAVARWDEAVNRIVLDFDYEFVREHIGSLWTDHGHNRTLVVSGKDMIIAETFADYTHITQRPLAETPEVLPVLQRARELFEQNRVRVPGGYSYRSIQGLDPSEYAAIGFLRIDGKPAMVGAMPIIPDQEKVRLPEGPPTILISAKFIDQRFIADINSQLSFGEMEFHAGGLPTGAGPIHSVTDMTGSALGDFRWISETRSETIWRTVVPVILVLSILLAILAFGIAWRIGKLTSSLQASERQNRYLALHDTLSGLANRLQFNRVLDTSVKALPDKSFAVIHCDLDKFKAVNDTYGHAAGDEVIKAVARRMTKVVGRGGLVARVGGDEFVVIMRTVTDRAGLTKLSDTLIASISEPIPLPDGIDAHIGLSIGISLAPDQGVDGESLVAAADAALYHSKETGRGRMFFAEDLPDADDLEKPRLKPGVSSSFQEAS
ncbi:diguanylate cyclase domain-containing protein [Roseibium sp.]|uniref:diguanylate cyclase domain-containing protein n=1 Tax=Roseibium sp. TaxID=1936156 RepID=UPI003A9807A8